MATRNDIVRKASLFTMNGLVDPRLMSDAVGSNAIVCSEKSDAKVIGVWRGVVQRVFGRVSRGDAGV